jgi:hypothetical protein
MSQHALWRARQSFRGSRCLASVAGRFKLGVMTEGWTIVDDERTHVVRTEDEGELRCSNGHAVSVSWAHELHGVPLICRRCREVLEL